MMTKESMLQNAFLNSLGLKDGVNYLELKYSETKGWDSIGHMRLIVEIEKAFDIMLETDDVLNMSSYEESIKILKKYEITIDA